MSDLARFQKLTVTDLAVALDLHPFDLIRTLVALDKLPADHRFDASDVEVIRTAAGLEQWWNDRTRVTITPEAPALGLLRDISHQLIERGVIGGTGTRLDNLLRGLPEAERTTALQLVRALASVGMLQSWTTAHGVFVSIVEGKEYGVADLAEGGTPGDELQEHLP